MARRKQLGAGYRKRSDGRVEYRWTDESGKRHSVCAATLEECEEKVERIREEVERGFYGRNAQMTLDDLYKEFTDHRSANVKPATVNGYRKKYNRITAIIQSTTKVQSIEPRQVVNLQKKLHEGYTRTAHRPNGKPFTATEGLSTATVNNTVTFFSAMLDYAVKMRVITENPARFIDTLKRPTDEVKAVDSIHKALTVEEKDKLFAQARSEQYYYRSFLSLLILTGMRCGEAAALTASDIDYVKRVIHITKTVTHDETGKPIIGDTPKTGEARDIKLTTAIERALAEQKEMLAMYFGNVVRLDRPQLFFTTSGSLIEPSIINDSLKRLCKRAGIEPRTVHVFRDSYATFAVRAGMTPKALMHQLGHRSIQMTLALYAQIQDDWLEQETEKVQITV